jgi:hypothetical protein
MWLETRWGGHHPSRLEVGTPVLDRVAHQAGFVGVAVPAEADAGLGGVQNARGARSFGEGGRVGTPVQQRRRTLDDAQRGRPGALTALGRRRAGVQARIVETQI